VNSEYGNVTEYGDVTADESFEPYSELAELYDRVMDHVDYYSWARYIHSIFIRFGPRISSILDLACGTGSLSVELGGLGYDITGTDFSHAMLVKAAGKFSRQRHKPRFFSADMGRLPLRCRFDAAICIYDSLNYMTDHDRFRGTIEEVAGVMKSGGLFVFDVCTIKNSELFFSHNSLTEDFGDYQYERICRYDRVRHIQVNYFTIIKNGRRYCETHYQRIYRLEEVREMIAHTPFDILACFDDMSFLPGTEDSERVHYVLRRK